MKNNQHGFSTIGILLIVVVIGLVGGAGWYVYSGQSKPEDTAAERTSATTAKTEAKETGTEAEKATYTSQLGGYTIRYPKDWAIEGWTGEDNMDKIPGDQLTGNENAILLTSSNATSNSFGAWFILKDGQSTTSSTSSALTQIPYADGKVVKHLTNGVDIWQANKSYTVNGNMVNVAFPPFETASGGQFGFKLKSGKYLDVSMSFAYAAKQTTTYSYEEQADSPELQKVMDVISGIAQN